MTIIVTGGAGFIGSNFILDWVERSDELLINIDKLTYAGNLQNLSSLNQARNYLFLKEDICDFRAISAALENHRPRAVINFAAESHVDRSIKGPEAFLQTNINGTFSLLEASRKYWESDSCKKNLEFRYLQVSTDEVYGSLEPLEAAFKEDNKYQPNSPYSASKAAADHLVRSWYHTYGLPVLTTNCSNNYGPYQFPEKFIPLIITNALNGKSLPIYGDGQQVRDWLYVKDHCDAICRVLEDGQVGDVYNVGGWNEKTNMEIVKTVCSLLDKYRPHPKKDSYENQIVHIADRPGHDRRYAVDATKIRKDLGWIPKENFETGIEKTVDWYLNNSTWLASVIDGSYKSWIDENYLGRRQ